ncbi:MAG TPA: helix-turn-helix domain-containing protein [Pseudonocardia sp.]|jgi:AcrR family transcriptional regulator|uniref:helix-turn-helix domain-containing protein n=1 Tax=Pseudonocardia sp. TaxID=60912 RepID=UPI002EDB0C61
MAGQPRRSAVQAPPRGTRPLNRRQLILAAAAELFYRRGYPNVSMGEIAEAVAIGPSALYRHFRGKQELLSEVVLAAFHSAGSAAGRDRQGPGVGRAGVRLGRARPP